MNLYYQIFKEQLFRLSAAFEEDLLKLTIFKDETAWNVNIPKDELIKQSKDVDFDQYYDNLKTYLRSCPQDVEFNFIPGKLTINLLLKNKMKILFFTSTLKQVNFIENIFYLVNKLYDDKTQYLETVNQLETQQKILQEDNKNLKEKLEAFVERKKIEEQKCYNKFVAILNEKKRHIQHQNDVLIAFRKGRAAVNNKEKNICRSIKNTSTKTIKKNKKSISESDSTSSLSDNDNNNYNTDSDKAENDHDTTNISPNPITKSNSPVPGSSKTKTCFMEDSPTTSFTFSKRLRTDNNPSLCLHLPETKNIESIQTKPIASVNSNEASDKSVPIVNFSTQDLLDNL